MEGEQWMTYDDVATARGTSRDAAIRWTQRRKLRRQPGNDGRVRVLVPPGVIVGERALHTDSAAIAALREANAGLVVRAERAEAEADRLRQAEAERQGRGRWQRLREAWRG